MLRNGFWCVVIEEDGDGRVGKFGWENVYWGAEEVL